MWSQSEECSWCRCVVLSAPSQLPHFNLINLSQDNLDRLFDHVGSDTETLVVVLTLVVRTVVLVCGAAMSLEH